MNPAPSLPAKEVRTPTPRKSNSARFLYPAFAALLFVLTLIGFQQFYLHGRGYPSHPLAPPIKALIVTHGIAMTAWIVLFLAQPLLILSGNRRLHMSVGWLGAAIALSILVLGLQLPIATTRFEPDVVLWGLHRKAFMAIPMFSVSLFAVFVAVGIGQRRRAEIHRPMMLLATLAVIAAATDRITGLPDLYAMTVWGRLFGPFFVALVIGALFLGVKLVLTRSFDRWFAAGFTVLVLVSAGIMRIATTGVWDRITTWLVR